MIVVTGGAGFLGSGVVQELNERGRTDLIIVDDVDHLEKEKNIASIKYHELVGKDIFLENVLNSNLKSIDAINIIIIKQIPNLNICLIAQGSKFPLAAEYNAAVPIKVNKITTKINKKFILRIFLISIRFLSHKYN